ncbi:tectonin domain-containing protein [Streptomyces cucumeris]|uniref:tectonin domain-containing protein n=1 Tax=Streptomyces cucumeris TaxID=2962890 RepID=UPI0020C89047|nr:tectonin domain-containing protein [Streptomyces sp. NEAU-Y11]MCP9211527.1 hypothetical protein [Streptomyces sp. NEAU-Y11]
MVALVRRVCVLLAAVLALGLLTATPSLADEQAGQEASSPAATDTAGVLAVTGRDRVYALAANRGSVWQRTGNGTAWERIGGAAKRIYAGKAGLFAISPDGSSVWRYDGEPDSWTGVGGAYAELAITGDDVYGLSDDRTYVRKWDGHRNWQGIGGAAQHIYAGEAGLFATSRSDGAIQKYSGTPYAWDRVGGPGADFAVSDEHLYGVTPDGSAVYQWSGKGEEWARIGGPAKSLHAGGAGLFATDPADGSLQAYSGEPNVWTPAGGPGLTFGVSDEHVYGVSPDGHDVLRWNGEGTSWSMTGGPSERFYERAKYTGFDSAPPKGAKRVRIQGQPGPDNGIIMARFFIHTEEAAFGTLHGDDRGHSKEPEAGYRMAMFWNTATGEVTFTVTQSTKTTLSRSLGVLDGNFSADVPARPIRQGDPSTEDTADWRNVIDARRVDGSGIHLKIRGVNSVLPVFAVDTDLRMELTGEGITVRRSGDSYPDFEAVQYRRDAAPASLARDDMAAGNFWLNGLHAMPVFPNIDRTWLNGDRTQG